MTLPGLARAARRRSWLLAALMSVIVLVCAAAPALAAPTINLTPSCHSSSAPYAFLAGLTGFPPNLPFTAEAKWSGGSSFTSYTTDANGNTPSVLIASQNPMGLVTVTVTATISGVVQKFVATLSNPCEGLTLGQEMCGDQGYLTYDFSSFTTCNSYAASVTQGQATPTFTLRPSCQSSPPALAGFTALALGFPPGTPITATLTDDQGTFTVDYTANRFGALGPGNYGLGPQSQITVTLSSAVGTFSKTLTSASCPS
jgi:hypothetical protein